MKRVKRLEKLTKKKHFYLLQMWKLGESDLGFSALINWAFERLFTRVFSKNGELV
jgi:hypothetical protein